MNDLTDEDLKRWSALVPLSSVPYDPAAMQCMARELQRHRDLVKRLEAWADACDRANHPIQSSRDVAAELRNRMRTL